MDVVVPSGSGFKSEVFFSLLQHLYRSADVHFPRLMKLVWGDWTDVESGAPDGPCQAGSAGPGEERGAEE